MSKLLVFNAACADWLSTGKEHGAFYLPGDEWVAPLLAWIEGSEND